MGMLDQAALQQAKKAQGETNDRLEALITEQRMTNHLLNTLINLISTQATQAGPPATTTWGRTD